MHKIRCKGCDVFFVALRSDAVTCSPKCRQRYKRMCDQITAEMARARTREVQELASIGITKPVVCRSCGIVSQVGNARCPVCNSDDIPIIYVGGR